MRLRLMCLSILLVSISSRPILAQVVGTVAGTTSTFPSTTQASKAPLGPLGTVAIDAQGNLYAPDSLNNIVVKITPDGVLTVVAGNGSADFSGDGGPATSASLFFPVGVAVDAAGNIYIADSFNNKVRKVSNGIITTFAGNGATGFSGDGGPATSAALSYPDAVAVDSLGKVYIADSSNGRVRKVSGGIISTFAGNGLPGFGGDGGSATQASLSNPAGLAVDSSNNVYIADENYNRIRKVSNGIITTVAGNATGGFSGDGGLASNASLNRPAGVAVDQAGNIYIADTGNYRVRKVANGVITTIAGSGATGFSGDGSVATSASFGGLNPTTSTAVFGPMGVTADAFGNVYVADTLNYRIRKVSGGTITTVAGAGIAGVSGDGGAATGALLFSPMGVSVDAAGSFYIADQVRVRKVTRGTIATVAGTGVAGFSGNGGLATQAQLTAAGTALDAAGNLYIADIYNNVVWKVSASGVINVIAGTGVSGPGGDGGLAINATLDRPTAVAVDSAGNVYVADSNNNRVRKISTNGIITTFAGNANATFLGDGGPAASALLSYPAGLAVDSSSNLYISDQGNGRIRKVTGGIITTVAGGGTGGDGGLATNASLYKPAGIALDSSGGLYIAEQGNDCVRKVLGGIITTIAGSALSYGFSGDGGPATAAYFRVPAGVAVDSSGNVFIADTNNFRVREVFAAPITYQVTPSALNFSASAGGSPPPSQSISLNSSVAGAAFFASASAPWLNLSLSNGTLPAALQVTADPSQLSEGSYSGSITITVPNATPQIRTVTVSFVVTAATPGLLAVSNQSLSLAVTQGASPVSLSLTVSNQGSGSIPFTASAATTTGGNWLSMPPTSGSLTPTTNQVLTITVAPGALGVGTYNGVITIASASTGQTLTVPVTLAISAPNASILLSQSGLTFTAVAQGGAPLSQSFGILNQGQGSMNWTAQPATLSGPGWLSIDQTSGTVATPLTSVSMVNVSINQSGLSAGTYYGQIIINAPGALNAPQSLSVVLNVLPPGSNPGPEIRPNGIIFTGQAGTIPASQSVLIGEGQTDSFVSGSIPTPTPFTYLPTTAQLQPNSATVLHVYPDFTNLSGGAVQRSTITLQFANGTARTISVLSVVSPNSSTGQSRTSAATASACSTSSLLVQPALLNDSTSTVTQSLPVTLQAQVVDGCGNPLTSGSVSATFSSGDLMVPLTHIGNGNWVGTWVPSKGIGANVTITFTASTTATAGSAAVTVGLGVNSLAPRVSGAANAASFAANSIVAPGELITIFGAQLEDQNQGSQPSTVPFPTSFNGAQLMLGNKALPLRYVGPGQINAQIPFETSPNSSLQLVLQRDGTALSVPLNLVVAPTDPAVYTQDGSGSGLGLAFDSQFNLLTASNPPAEGGTIVIYANGLGGVSPALPTGTPAPLSGALSQTVNPVTVTIGGVPASVVFAGLAPGYPDLYQVNAVVPCGGNGTVTLTVSAGGRFSRSVDIPGPTPGKPGGTPGVVCGSQ